MMSRGPDSITTLLVVFGVTAAGSVAASMPLGRFDNWWVARVNTGRKVVDRLVYDQPSSQDTQSMAGN